METKRNDTKQKDAKTIENDWNNQTKRNGMFELIIIDKVRKNLDSKRGWGAAGRGGAWAAWRAGGPAIYTELIIETATLRSKVVPIAYTQIIASELKPLVPSSM